MYLIHHRQEDFVLSSAEVYRTEVTQAGMDKLDKAYLSADQTKAVEQLAGQVFDHKWQLAGAPSRHQ